MTHQNQIWSSAIISHLIKCGIRHFCIAPGSRSSPLIASAAMHPLAKMHLHYDERGLAFFALGLAKAKKVPVAIIVTSGSALGHLYPALTEAVATHTPLFLITADRPPELLHCGSNQTIDQLHFFGRYVCHFANIAPPEPSYSLEYLRSMLTAAARQSFLKSLPVHINVMLRGPFEAHSEEESPKEGKIHFVKMAPSIELEDISFLIDLLNETKKGLIIVGEGHQEVEPLLELAEKLSWPIFADITSNVRRFSHPLVVPHHSLLVQSNLKNLEPGLILQFGERLTSKHLLEWIEALSLPCYVQIKEHEDNVDPTHKTTTQITCPLPLFCDTVMPEIKQKEDNAYYKAFEAASKNLKPLIDQHLDAAPSSELGLVSQLQHRQNLSYNLFIGSGLLIRAFDHLFYPKEGSFKIYCNRGVSGIDGNIATLAGIATGKIERLVAFIGDQAFLHDLNSLPLIRHLPITLVVVNNGGGGIFETLPIAKDKKVCHTYLVNPHTEDLSAMASSFGIKTFTTSNVDECLDLIEGEESAFIEFKVDRDKSTEQWTSLMDSVAQKSRSKLLGTLSCYFS